MRHLTGFCLALLLGANAGAASAQQMDQRKLFVQGEGVVLAQPDMAMITVGVTKIAPKAAEALTLNSRQMKQIFTVLKEAQITPRDMQTSGLSLHPRRERRSKNDRPRKIIGYEAVNLLRIRIRDLDTLGEVLDRLALAGADQIQSINFAMQAPRPLKDQARQAAIRDARAKAELFAKAAEVTLGSVWRIEESQNVRQPLQFPRGTAMAVESVPVAQGELGITASVQVVYLLE